MAEAEEEVKKPKQEGSKDLNEPEDIKAASESTSIRCCRINSNFSGRVCWSNLELDSLLEPQEEAKEDGTCRTEDGKTKRAEKDMLIDTINKDQSSSKGEAENLLAESEKVVEQLKGKMQRQKEFERRLYESFVTQTSQLEQAHIFIDKWKQKMSAVSDGAGIATTSYEENYWLRLQVERLENELGIQRNGQNPWEEVKRLRKELELAIEAEENSKSAMDDLAAVIKEVAAEANQAKEKLASTEQQLQMMKEETETLRSMINIKERANESLTATINRLKIELKVSMPSLNGKETEFVDSIKKAEEENVNMQEENARLLESLNEAKDESRKIRDLLKQANVEIAQLKDSLAVAVAVDENTKEQKKICKESCSEKGSKGGGKSTRDSKGSGKSSGQLKGRGRSTEDLKSCAGSFCSIPLHVPGLSSRQREVEEVHQTDDSLTGSIFDIVQPASVELHHTRSASAVTLTDDEISFNSEDFDSSERLYADDIEIEKEPHPKKKVLLKKLSELWRRKNHSHSHSHSNGHNQSHDHNQKQNEVAIE